MNDWQTVRLGDLVVNYDSRRIPVRGSSRKQGIYPYYGASGIVDYVDGYIFDGEFLLIGEDGENLRSRKTPLAFMAKGKFWVNNHAHIVKGNDRADTRFLAYALSIADISGYVTGSAIPKLSQSSLNEIRLPCPPLLQQRAIARILGSLDDKIELNRRMNATLEELAQTRFRTLMATAKTESGELRDGWKTVMVSDLGKVICGKTPPTRNPENFGGNVQFITIPDMHNNLIIMETERTLSALGVKTQVNKTLSPGSICVSCIATLGLVSLTTETAQTNQQINSVSPYDGVSKYYCFFALRELTEQIKAHGSGGSVLLNLNTSQFATLKLVLPTTSIQDEFETKIQSLFEKIVANQRQNRALAQLRDTLLPRLLSGKLPVSELRTEPLTPAPTL